MEPALGSILALKIFKSVDFPLPDKPTIPIRFPMSALNEISESEKTVPSLTSLE